MTRPNRPEKNARKTPTAYVGWAVIISFFFYTNTAKHYTGTPKHMSYAPELCQKKSHKTVPSSEAYLSNFLAFCVRLGNLQTDRL